MQYSSEPFNSETVINYELLIIHYSQTSLFPFKITCRIAAAGLLFLTKVSTMRRLLHLSRIAFVCNLFFLLSALLQWTAFVENEAVVSTIIITGYFMAIFIFSPLVNFLYGVHLVLRKNLFLLVPRWLVVGNFVFLLLQILFIIFYLNDTFHYQQ